MLLKDELDFIFENFGSNFNSTGKKFLINLAKDEKKIDYNNLFFNIYDKSAVKSVDFVEEFGTLYDLFLLDNSLRIISSTKAQTEFLEVITALKIIISSIKTDVTDQSEEEKKKVFAEQENALDADSRAIQQIVFTGKTDNQIRVYYILEQSKETILEFSKGATKVL